MFISKTLQMQKAKEILRFCCEKMVRKIKSNIPGFG